MDRKFARWLHRERALDELGERAVGQTHASERPVARHDRGSVRERPAVLDRGGERTLAEDFHTGFGRGLVLAACFACWRRMER